MRGASRQTLSIDVLGGAQLPTEFRLFAPGVNKTSKGDFLFDEAAARAVMAAYQAWGVDLAIDLEHQMLDAAPSADPTARDARGWCKLEVRPDGSLWAVDVRWTPDGAARLAEKRQRYVSPAFNIDPESRRVTEIVNVAITAMPATHHTPALVAASRGAMDPKLVQQALDALINGDAKAALEILQNLIASAAGGDPDAATEDAPPPAGDGGADEAQEMAAPAAAPMPPEEDPAKKAAGAVAASRLLSLSGRSTVAEALADVALWREAFVELAAEKKKIADAQAALEAEERVTLARELIALGAEFPSTVWLDDKAASLKPRWQGMPIAELRAHVAEQRKARGGATKASKSQAPKPADGRTFSTPFGAVTLSDDELKTCAEVGAKPEVYAAKKAALDAQKRK